MSYIDDFNDNVNNNKKIPYDDIPITRNSREPKYYSQRSSRGSSSGGVKLFVSLIAVLLIVNIVLCCVMFYNMRHGKVKEVNIYNKDVIASEESVSTLASNIAMKSAINIAVGGNCSDENGFYNYTLSKGAGVIYDVDETRKTIYFITCYHVVDGYNLNEIWVLLPTKLVPFKAKLLSYSAHYDIAVLTYNYTEATSDLFLDGCAPIKAYDSTYLSVGDRIFAVGNPLSNGFSVTEGAISKINTLMTVESNSFKTREIQVSAPINKGNSGGGLFNAKGEFVGLVNSKLSVTGVEGTAYAIPGNLVLGIAGSIIRNNKGTVKHGGYASYVDLGAELGHDADLGASFVDVDFNDETKSLLRYYVVVNSVSGAISYGKLGKDDYIDEIEFSVYEKDKIVNKKIKMYNKFVFEDYSFSIVENSEIILSIKTNGVGELKKVTLVASSISIID